MPEEPTWLADYGKVLAFAHILVWCDYLDTASDVVGYFEKPHKWETERELWVGCGSPLLDDPGWEWFLQKLERGERSV